jgi:ectoine hydroxylase
MRLQPAQHEQFHRDGYLFFPGLFTPAEVGTLTRALRALPDRSDAHLHSPAFARLAHHPRLVEPVEELFGERLYVHQLRVRGRDWSDGEAWQCHADDHHAWAGRPLQAGQRAVNVALFLDDVHGFAGPLMFIPGSHRRAALDGYHDLSATPYPSWTLDYPLIGRLVARAGGKRSGVVAPRGPAGSAILLDAGLVLAPGSDRAPFNRVGVHLSLCAVSPSPTGGLRQADGAHRDCRPIECLPDDCLLKDYPVDLPGLPVPPAALPRAQAASLRAAA